ncbi:nicotinate-nucleotide adenylyltransferase [Suicoccus acidiformans]|uniref:Probable nicotinate-nucleotide adenylyltransferase n=1 Tax=Suicoccus acidiformans TaxID=2036206 RepID=A0A347WJ97_9LACT|nr:nicotinate-nucleotide adenylyltransferase [Suicoccus acidiformans]AXY25154.1 nicotinate-nucleotide adenylyltransferase [Suicoccus acidiformans]
MQGNVTATPLRQESVFYEKITLTQEAQPPTDSGRHRIGILGGTFNPPHLGHLLMAEQVGNQLELDEVWFMPTAKPPHAPGKKTIASQHRLEMVKLAIEDNPLFRLQDYEVNQGGKNYTVDTMRHFVEQYPQSDFYFIIGADSANDLHTWKDIHQLSELVQFVGVRRPGMLPYKGDIPVLWVESPLVDISSSEIRLRVYLEQSIKYQVPAKVEAYIKEHELYDFSM